MTNIKFETIERAYQWNSFEPERRAKAILSEITALETEINDYPALQGADRQELRAKVLARLDSLYSRWIAATGRCANPMITGAAKFPVERNRKAMAAADKHAQALSEFINGWRGYVDKKTAAPIDALAEARQALETAIQHHTALKADKSARRHGFELQYANLAVKRARKRLHALESQVTGTVTSLGRFTVQGEACEVKENRVVGRYQVYFDNKPPADIITRIKRLNFKWSPRFGCWQNFLSNNGWQRLQELIKQ